MLFLFGFLVVVVLGSILGLDLYGQKRPNNQSFDAIVVAGCRVKSNGEPSLALQARVRHAVALYKDGYAPKLLFTGGTPDDRPSEALAARIYAESLGVDPSVILLEEESTSTDENARFAKEQYAEFDKIVVVSDSYHIFRSERVFGRYFSEVVGSGRIPAWNVRWMGAAREVLALIYYSATGKL